MASEKKLTAFISHSSKDSAFIESHLIPHIESAGIRAWYSTLDIHTAEEWFEKIKDALDECDFLIVVASQHSANSEWVKAEVDWALEYRRGRVVPVRIDSVDPGEIDLRLRRIQQVELGESNPEAIIQTLEDIAAGKDEFPHTLRGTHAPSRPIARRVPWQFIALAIVLLGITLFVFRDKFINPSPQQPSSPSNGATSGESPPAPATPKPAQNAPPEEDIVKTYHDNAGARAALDRFLKRHNGGNVPPEEYESKLQEFEKRYDALIIEIQQIQAENDPGAAEIKTKALDALREGELDKVDALLKKLESRLPPASGLRIDF